MAAVRLRYRLQQTVFYGRQQAMAPEIPADALALLSPPMLHQFRILDPRDQQHLITVHRLLAEQQADEDVLTAGLIHDVGKACAKCRITVLDRGMHVIFSQFFKWPYKRFAAMEIPPAPLRGLHRLANHPERGALAAQQAGYNDRIVYLVLHHESGGNATDSGLQMLRQADNSAEAR